MNNIEFFYEDIQELSLNIDMLNGYIKDLIISEKRELGEISIIFCSDKYLLGINKQYLSHNYYTDIITFDYVEDDVISGDLFISLDTIKTNAKEYDVSIIKELYRVVFHGILHLVGYNDKTEEEQNLMTAKENQYLAIVDFRGKLI